MNVSNTSPTMADIAAPPVPADQTMEDSSSLVPPAGSAPQPPAEPEQISETLYIQNLNEKIKVDVLKTSLRGLFKTYGEVLDVVAHDNLRMRGQAFVSFADAEVAKKALKEVRGFPLYSKPMVRGCYISRLVIMGYLSQVLVNGCSKSHLPGRDRMQW